VVAPKVVAPKPVEHKPAPAPIVTNDDDILDTPDALDLNDESADLPEDASDDNDGEERGAFDHF